MPRRPGARLLLALLAAVACAEPVVPVPMGEPFTPPASYLGWWQATEACSGRTGRMSRIVWMRVPADSGGLFVWDGRRVAGLWHEPHTIYISDALLDLEPLVRHEMLHDLLQVAGHPSTPFITPCNVRWPVVIPAGP